MKFKKLKVLPVLLFVLMSITIFCDTQNKNKMLENEKLKARTVVTTDCELDDMNSLVRLMLYTNEIDLEGIVVTSSMFHYAGDPEKGIKPFNWTGMDPLYDLINRYEKIFPNLKAQSKDFPTPDFLRKNSKLGNISNSGEMEKDTDGSEFLKKLILDNDSRTLYIQTWGGTNTTARALKSIEDKYKNDPNWEKIKEKINDKLVLYVIMNQDDSFEKYIAKEWPNLKIVFDKTNFWHFAYAWQAHTDKVNTKLKGDWMYKNIKENKGPLLEKYAVMGDGNIIPGAPYEEQRGTDDYLKSHPEFKRYDFISEGDTPSFLFLIDNGLRSVENPTYGGWGGRFAMESAHLWNNTAFDFNPYINKYEAEYTLTRWFDDIQDDFAARVDWAVAKSYKEVNHNPTVIVKEGLNLNVKPGQKIVLHAKASDPDGDKVSFKWWRYHEADTYQEYKGPINNAIKLEMYGLEFGASRELAKDEIIDSIKLKGANTNTVKFEVPKDAKSGETIHIIVEAIDNGKHNLKHYQRVILTVK